ncbi:MAG TPA: FAD-dependent oxidoreductase [Bacteroidales bacterium]|nr:FAD-dependent oxidoreductase [Bacteroidales bacterium]HPT20750.1 FAD-dependent oxidoreductase [Bacteroidales bacterium]
MKKISYALSFFFFSILILSACKSKEQNMNTDVLVIGGTTSGISAGLQSARLNVPTLVVEETPWLGGMLTAGGVSATDGNHYLNSGIWNEFRGRLRNYYGGEAALRTGWVSLTQFEPHIGDSILKSMAAETKQLSVIYGYHLTNVLKESNKVTGAVFENEKGDCLTVKAKVVIDATDLGDGLAMAGAGYDLGMEARSVSGEEMAPESANNIVQDLTWVAVLKDYGAGTDKTIKKPRNYNPGLFKGCCAEAGSKIEDCDKMLSYGRLPNNKFMINWPDKGNDIYLNVVEMGWAERNKELIKAKERTLAFVYYIQTELGYKNIGLADDEFPTKDRLAFVPYHREGRRLRGIERFNMNHILDRYGKEPLYRTGISVGDYPVDHHHGCNPDAPEIKFPAVPSFNIPLGTLIPEKTDGLIVSDKAISVSNLINGSTRLQPCVMLTGQAAGALAALSVINNQNVRDINIRKLQQTLLDAGAYLMPLFDVSPADKEFQSIQRITASGILKLTGEPFQWANRSWFYPDSTLSVKEFSEGLNTFKSEYAVTGDQSLLTLQKAANLLSAFLNKDVTTEIKEIWNSRMSRKFDLRMPVTRRELSVLTDELIRPFETRSIGFDGNYR